MIGPGRGLAGDGDVRGNVEARGRVPAVAVRVPAGDRGAAQVDDAADVEHDRARPRQRQAVAQRARRHVAVVGVEPGDVIDGAAAPALDARSGAVGARERRQVRRARAARAAPRRAVPPRHRARPACPADHRALRRPRRRSRSRAATAARCPAAATTARRRRRVPPPPAAPPPVPASRHRSRRPRRRSRPSRRSSRPPRRRSRPSRRSRGARRRSRSSRRSSRRPAAGPGRPPPPLPAVAVAPPLAVAPPRPPAPGRRLRPAGAPRGGPQRDHSPSRRLPKADVSRHVLEYLMHETPLHRSRNRAYLTSMAAPLSPVPPEEDRALAAAATLARWLDDRFIDPLLGLFLPGVGDLLGSALGLYPVLLAWRRRAPKVLLARMMLNLAADAAGGAIPVLGDIWDFLFRAHARNLEAPADALRRGRGPGPLVRHARGRRRGPRAAGGPGDAGAGGDRAVAPASAARDDRVASPTRVVIADRATHVLDAAARQRQPGTSKMVVGDKTWRSHASTCSPRFRGVSGMRQ